MNPFSVFSKINPLYVPLLRMHVIDEEAILSVVSYCYGVKYDDLFTRRRMREIVAPRHCAIFFIRHYLGWTFKRIGALFGQDHSTVINAIDRAKDVMAVDSDIFHAHFMRVRTILAEDYGPLKL